MSLFVIVFHPAIIEILNITGWGIYENRIYIHTFLSKFMLQFISKIDIYQ